MKCLNNFSVCAVISAFFFATLLTGCRPAEVSVDPVVDNGTSNDTVPFQASFDCLEKQAEAKGDVDWEVALTLAAISEAVYETRMPQP